MTTIRIHFGCFDAICWLLLFRLFPPFWISTCGITLLLGLRCADVNTLSSQVLIDRAETFSIKRLKFREISRSVFFFPLHHWRNLSKRLSLVYFYAATTKASSMRKLNYQQCFELCNNMHDKICDRADIACRV